MSLKTITDWTTRHGNIYFASDAFAGCERAEVMSTTIPVKLKRDVEERFVIGLRSRSMLTSTGQNAHDYPAAVAKKEIAWLSLHAVPKKAPVGFAFLGSNAQYLPAAHISLHEKFLDMSSYILPEDQRFVHPTLWHWDMHASNIFVQDNRITCLIDWQSAWAGPLSLQFQYPKLVSYNGPTMLRLPENFKSLEDDEKARIRKQVERSLVLYVYKTETAKVNPLLDELLQIPHRVTRKHTVEFAANTWDEDIIPFRQCLIRLERFVHPALTTPR
jgi:hypothetical protein